MNIDKQKILVLSDFKNAPTTTLKSAVSLAKIIDGSVQLFCVKKPLDIVNKESHLSAIRAINQTHNATSKEIKDVVETTALNYNINVKYSYEFGNVKNEIKAFINNFKPDFIVLRKRKKATFSFKKGDITNFILKNYTGQILIVDEKKPIEPNKDFSLSLLNNSLSFSDDNITNVLIKSSKLPLQIFKTSNAINKKQNAEILHDKKVVEHLLKKEDNVINTVANCLTENNTNLLCIHRNNKKENISTIKKIINKLDCSLILTN